MQTCKLLQIKELCIIIAVMAVDKAQIRARLLRYLAVEGNTLTSVWNRAKEFRPTLSRTTIQNVRDNVGIMQDDTAEALAYALDTLMPKDRDDAMLAVALDFIVRDIEKTVAALKNPAIPVSDRLYEFANDISVIHRTLQNLRIAAISNDNGGS